MTRDPEKLKAYKKAYMKAYNARNRETLNAQRRDRYAKNRDAVVARRRAYEQAMRQAIKFLREEAEHCKRNAEATSGSTEQYYLGTLDGIQMCLCEFLEALTPEERYQIEHEEE